MGRFKELFYGKDKKKPGEKDETDAPGYVVSQVATHAVPKKKSK